MEKPIYNNFKFKKISNFQNAKKYFENGFSIAKISRLLELNSRTVTKYISLDDLEFSNLLADSDSRLKKLEIYRAKIENKLLAEPGISANSIFIWLNKNNPNFISFSEKTVFNFVKTIRYEKSITKNQIEKTWFTKILTGIYNKKELYEGIKDRINQVDFEILYKYLINKSIAYKKRAMSLLFYLSGKKSKEIASYLKIEKKTIDNYINIFTTNGILKLFDLSKSTTKKTENTQYKDEVFKILHSPPTNFGINRTSWKYEDIERTLKSRGFSISKPLIRKILKNAGFSMKKARKVLTSNDPKYLEKLKEITNILSNLGINDRFFSIDEYGPFSIKIQGGKSLTSKDEQKTFPQWQRSKGKLIITGALELSTNQMTHFYSEKKNTDEMIKLLYILIEQYKYADKIYLSWDAASWHISKELKEKVQEINTKVEQGVIQNPIVKLSPLPSSAQFLNVIESVYSGMARAIIHNSDYQSKAECIEAIDRYFLERNEHFKKYPKVAGNKIWGKERVKSEFNESNNCKDPKYR